MNLKLTAISSAVICTLALTACGNPKKEAEEAAKRVPPAPETMLASIDMLEGRVAVPVQFTDAKTGQPILQNVILIASDDIADKNVYENASLGTTANNSNGLSTIFLKADAVKTASAENPVKLRLIASSEGYFSSSIDVIYDGTEPEVKNITLVKTSAPPAGVAVAEQKNVTTSTDGTLQVPIQLSAKTAADDPNHRGAGASFSLPAGTVLKDRSGTPLTGDLKVTIGYFSPNTRNIEEVFPGGLSPDYVRVRENGQWINETGTFITAGLLAVDIVDSKGRKAHQFGDGQRASMTIETPSGLINPQTNKPVKEGDTIPVWSHSEANGLWQRELIGTFKKNDAGNLAVTYTVNHLSYWNLDWKTDACSSIPATFSKSFYTKNGIVVSAKMANYGTVFTETIFDSLEELGLWNAPNNREITFEARDQQGKLLGTGVKAADGTCGNIVIQLDEQFAANNPLTGYCPNPVNVKFSKPFHSLGGVSLWNTQNKYYSSFNDHSSQLIHLPQNDSITLNVTDGYYGNIVGTATKPGNSCDDITINMSEEFIQKNQPVEYCPNPVKVVATKPFFTSSYGTWVYSIIDNYYAASKMLQSGQNSLEFTDIPKNRNIIFELSGAGIQATKPIDSCADVSLNTDALPSGSRQVIIKPRIQLNEQLSYDDVKTLISNMTSLSEQTRTEILAYTHPQGADSASTFTLNNQSYQVLMDRWLSRGQIVSLQTLQAFQIQVSDNIYVDYTIPVTNSQGQQSYIYGGTYAKKQPTGEITVTLPAGVDLNSVLFWTYGYINDKFIGVTKYVNIPANVNTIDIAFSSIPAIRDGIYYLKTKCENGLPISDTNTKYCDFLK